MPELTYSERVVLEAPILTGCQVRQVEADRNCVSESTTTRFV